MQLIRMAWRNVWRNTRRSVVTIGAMTFALWVMILYSGLVEGYMQGMQDDVLDLEVGELQIVAEGYRDDASLERVIPEVPALITGLEGLGLRAAARLNGGGLAAVGGASSGVSLVGLDVARDATVTRLAERVDQGKWLDPADPHGVVLGRRVARTLEASLGSGVVVLSQAADGSIANDLYTVRGIMGPVGDAIDRSAVLMTEGAFRELMVLPAGAHLVIVRVPPGQDLPATATKVAALAPGLDVATWRELLPIVATMLDSSRGLISIVFFIIYIAVAILILNAMLMAVFERIREFGVMKAIGYGPELVFGLIFVESLLQTTLATVGGVLLAIPAAGWLSTVGIDVGSLGGASVLGMSMHQTWKGVFAAPQFTLPITLLWGMVGLAVVWPALKAARLRPLDAMRYR